MAKTPMVFETGSLPNRSVSDPRVITSFHRRFAGAAMGALVLIGVIATPFANTKLQPIPGYMTAFGAAMVVINVLLAALLFSKGAIEGRGDATRLGTAYFFVAIIFIPLIATFPGGIMPGSLIGTAISSVWLWSFWHAGFGLCIIRYAWPAGPTERPSPLLVAEMAGVAVAVLALTVVSTSLLRYLPTVLADGHTLFSGLSALLPLIILVILTVALVLVCRLGAKTPEHLWLVVAMVAALFDVWLTYQGSDRFSLGWYLSKCASLFTSLIVLITLLHEVTRLYRRAEEANAVLTGLAQQDGLTGLSNRRRFDEVILQEWRRSRREGSPVSLLMIDVDHFKNYNDFYGHPEGDLCLRQVAALLQTIARRPTDTAARYGGEEFVLLLPATDASGAADMAERVQAGLRALAIDHGASPLHKVTVSIGVASLLAAPELSPDALVAEADRGLYRAKRRGRDQICWADDRVLEDGNALLAKFLLTPASKGLADVRPEALLSVAH
jgi:diguanylate cyclase (GGDEF)-like protein